MHTSSCPPPAGSSRSWGSSSSGLRPERVISTRPPGTWRHSSSIRGEARPGLRRHGHRRHSSARGRPCRHRSQDRQPHAPQDGSTTGTLRGRPAGGDHGRAGPRQREGGHQIPRPDRVGAGEGAAQGVRLHPVIKAKMELREGEAVVINGRTEKREMRVSR